MLFSLYFCVCVGRVCFKVVSFKCYFFLVFRFLVGILKYGIIGVFKGGYIFFFFFVKVLYGLKKLDGYILFCLNSICFCCF